MKDTFISRTSSIEITPEMHKLHEQRDRTLDDADAPALPPEMWAKAAIGKYYRPPVLSAIDPDVALWLKSNGGDELTQINTILRQAMERDQRSGAK